MFSCKVNDKGFHIYGKIDNVKEQVKVYLKNSEDKVIEDSTLINNRGEFIFNGIIEYPQKYTIIYKTKSSEKKHYIWIENTIITIEGTLNDFKSIKINAGNEQRLFDKMNEKWEAFFYPEYQRLTKEKKYDSISSLVNKAARVKLDFCVQNLNSHAALESIYLNRNGISKDSLALILQEIDSSILKNKYVKSLLLYTKSPNLDVNENYLDFSAKNVTGENIRISELLKKGNPILLIFGGLTCMQEKGRKILKEFHNSYKDKIEIVVFSDREECIYSLKYKMDIPLVSDMKGDHSPIKIQYNIIATPTVFLINREGVISMKSLGYGNHVNVEALKLLK
ncbi:MAG: DUF4369 domain-containing protein [Flavobacteriaceae bacterium]